MVYNVVLYTFAMIGKYIIMGRKLNMDELNRLTVDQYKNADKIPIIVVLDNIRSLSNIGSVFRTCDAFRIQGIRLCGITATPPHREIHKTALSATDSVDWKYFQKTEQAILELKKNGYTIAAIEQVENSIMLDEFIPSPNGKYALIFGNEVMGVDEKCIQLSDHCIEIPQWGTKHSINVSVSVGIVLWDIVMKIK